MSNPNISSDAIRVAVLDDHRLVAEGIAALIDGNGIDVELIAASWSELIEHPSMPVDVAIVDLHMRDGILISTKVRALGTMGSATVVISRHTDASSVTAAIRAGAHAFVAKADHGHELVAAVAAAARGARHLADHHEAVVAESSSTANPGLGRQEERALVLYAGGHSILDVAADMQTTEETVKSYIKRARRKYRDVGIDIGTRALLRRHAAREGWFGKE